MDAKNVVTKYNNERKCMGLDNKLWKAGRNDEAKKMEQRIGHKKIANHLLS